MGANLCLDHRITDYALLPERIDVVLDCAASSHFHARRVLAPSCAYLTTLP